MNKRPSLEFVYGKMPQGSVFESVVRNLEVLEKVNDEKSKHAQIDWTHLSESDPANEPNYGGLTAHLWNSLAYEIVENYLPLITAWSSDKNSNQKIIAECSVVMSFFMIGTFELAKHFETQDVKRYLEDTNTSLLRNFFLIHPQQHAEHEQSIYKTSNSYVQLLLNDEKEGTQSFVKTLSKVFLTVAVTSPTDGMHGKLVNHLKQYFEMYAKQFNSGTLP